MLKKIFSRKLLVLFMSMAIIGFFIGYDYALITTRQDKANIINVSNLNGKRINKYGSGRKQLDEAEYNSSTENDDEN